MFILKLETLKAGEIIAYTGEMIVMRDAAQKRLAQYENCPLNLKGSFVFYAGPAKTPAGSVIGSIGPTTSARMDKYLEMLFLLGVQATIGKGVRSNLAKQMCRQYSRVYFAAPSGAAAALSVKISSHEILLFEELQSEAIQRISVKDFPLVVGIDARGHSIWE